MADPWRKQLLSAVPRLLSMQDRDPSSPTHGSFDRTWWGWKFSDLSAPRAQEAVLSLAALWTLADAENPCHGRAEVLGWIAAGLQFLGPLQHRDGSFDEAYPNERSWGATAFLGFAVAETLALVGSALEAADRRLAREIVLGAARFLSNHDESHGFVANHRAAAAAALAAAAELDGGAHHGARADALLAELDAASSSEGWLPEYGGADPGYQSHALGYLASAIRRRGASDEVLRRCFAFLGWFVAPDGCFGGEYGSRNTSFWFPSGAESSGDRIPEAGALARRMRAGVATGLDAMDAQNFVPLLGSVALAALHPCGDGPTTLPTDAPTHRYFARAGLIVRATSRYVAVVSAHKGVVIATGRDGSAFSSAGWVSGDTTSHGGARRPAVVDDDCVRLELGFAKRRHDVLDPVKLVGFRLATLGPGRVPALGSVVKRALVRRLVTGRSERPGSLVREIRFGDSLLELRDRVTGTPAVHAERFTALHMGSSRYFQARELAPPAPTEVEERRGRDVTERTVHVRF